MMYIFVLNTFVWFGTTLGIYKSESKSICRFAVEFLNKEIDVVQICYVLLL